MKTSSISFHKFTSILSLFTVISINVQASEEVWASYLKFASRFCSKGCHHYDLLGMIFNNTTATRQMQYASTNSPPDSDVERELENYFLTIGVHYFLTIGVHIDLNREIGSRGFSEGDEGTSNKNKCAALFPQSDLPSRSKSSKSTKMDEAIEAWEKSLNAKTEVSLARLKRKGEKEVSSPYRELSFIEDCMEILEAMEGVKGVNDDAYAKALDKFTNLDWRKMFVKTSDPRRRVWLSIACKNERE